MMHDLVVRLLHALGQTRIARAVVYRSVYPTIAEALQQEVQPDVDSPSGVMEAIAWKVHSQIVLAEELRPTGIDCAADGMRHDNETRTRVLDVVLEEARTIQGAVLEFGVGGGDSMRALAERNAEREVFGFDSFEGLPESWWTRPTGAFSSPPPEEMPSNVRLVVGLFAQTVPEFLTQWTDKVAIVHVDCDLYQSTLDCMRPLVSRLQPGTIVLFDEYWNYPVFAEHEWLAWRQLRTDVGIEADCVAFDGRRAAFKICAVDSHV